MIDNPTANAAGAENPRRLFVYNGGFLTQSRVRRILQLSGWDIKIGKPGSGDHVGVWGKSPTAPRGEAVADHTGNPVIRIEDTFLRSIHPGRAGEPPLGLNIDTRGVHFDSSAPSDLEHLLATNPLDDTALLNRARDAITAIRAAHLSKYNAFDPGADLPKPPYVLVLDQSRGDASIKYGQANAATFKEMLVFALTEHPGSKVVIKSHPETNDGHRDGHFGPKDENDRVRVLRDPVSPWALMEGATTVYTVSSQMGFEAIFAGHKPRVFGQPFYAGWGLTQDENPVARRERKLTRAQLFAAAMILYPTWYDPYNDRLCELEQAIHALSAQARAWREDHQGYVARGMRMWKRRHLQQFFHSKSKIVFASDNTPATLPRRVMIWASHPAAAEAPADTVRVEDGFLRSRGLGARLVPPLSLVTDDLGIYYDPSRESRLERLIAASPTLPDAAIRRAEALIRTLTKSGVTKYNLEPAPLPDLPEGPRILVPGQVEDDASIQLGCGAIRTNLALLQFTRENNPDAVILYKPHPDVEAGLRPGKIDASDALNVADVVIDQVDAATALDAVNDVWTMTSLLGFEGLLRGKVVTCVGTPFYAGWGLTQDFGKIPVRRAQRPTLPGLVHAALIDYPRYHDPLTNTPCPVEVAVQRLVDGSQTEPGALNRSLSKLQGLFASYAHLWR